MLSNGATQRGGYTRLVLCLGGAMLLVLLVTPGDAAPGTRAVSPFTTIALQEALAVNSVGISGRGCSCIHIPRWPHCRSPWKPPWWPPQPPWWPPKPPWWPPRPPWLPGPPPWWRGW